MMGLPKTTPAADGDELAPCSFCGLATKRSVLSALSRCHSCFVLAQRKPVLPQVPREAVPAGAGGLAWAWRLKWRERAGEQLTKLQRESWRKAIEAHGVLSSAREGADVDEHAIGRALVHTGDIGRNDRRDPPMFDEYGAPLE